MINKFIKYIEENMNDDWNLNPLNIIPVILIVIFASILIKLGIKKGEN